jgi:hypothetical protein
MGVIDAALHLLALAAPAFFVALLVSYAGQFFKQNKPLAPVFIQKFAINFIVCLGVLLIGLVLTGRDGKMLSYMAMIVASATVQWLLSGSWRK